MNALRLDPTERTFAQFYEPQRQRLFTRKTAVAVGITALCYGGLGFYFMTMKGPPTPVETIIDDGPIVIQPWRPIVPKPTVPVRETTPTVRNTAPPTTWTPPTTIPFPGSDEPVFTGIPTDFGAPSTDNSSSGEIGPVGPATEPAGPVAPPVIRNPVWISRPTASQVERLYPDRAIARGVSGRAVLLCTVRPNGSMAGCDVESETPGGYRFGEAALAMARYFRISPKTVDGQVVEGARVQIAINFSLPD